MKRLLAVLAAVSAAVAIAGCGGGDDGKSPLDNALGYLPEDTPFAFALDTDLDGSQYDNASQIVEKFPLGEQALEALRGELEDEDVDFERDLRPLLGNPFVVGAPDAGSFLAEDETVFVAAIETKDGEKLKDLVDEQNATELGEKEGAKLYEDTDDDDVFAIKDEVLIVADSRETLENALEQRKADDRMDEDTFDEALDELPDEAIARVYSNLQGLLEADGSTEQARRVKWVDALRTLGATASAQSDEVTIDFNLKTDDSDLSGEDLPLASGSESPRVATTRGTIAGALRNPSQIYEFALGAARAIDPDGTAEFERDLATISRVLDVDLKRDLVDQLSGDLVVNARVDGKFAVRGEVEDPAAVRQTVRKVARIVPRVAQEISGERFFIGRSRDVYALTSGGGTTFTFGVRGNAFEVSNDPGLSDRLAKARSASVPGAEGSLVVTGDTAQVAAEAIRGLGLEALLGATILTRPLGELTGSVETDASGIRGKLTQEID